MTLDQKINLYCKSCDEDTVQTLQDFKVSMYRRVQEHYLCRDCSVINSKYTDESQDKYQKRITRWRNMT